MEDKQVGGLLVEVGWAWPREAPEAVMTALREAASKLLRASSSRLYLQLVGSRSHSVQVAELEEVLAGYYVSAMEVLDSHDEDALPEVIVLPPFAIKDYDPRVDLANLESVLTLLQVSDEEQKKINAGRSDKGFPPLSFARLHAATLPPLDSPQLLTQGFPAYKETVLGGTFDRLHAGHKIMLTVAVLSTLEKMVIGVTGDEMLKNKKHGEVMQPYTLREANTLSFLEAINPLITYEAVQINDPYGPTLTGPTFNAIIASEETKKGAIDINEKRKANGLQPLEIIIVGLVNAPSGLGEGKLSSTALREKYKKQHS